MNDGVMLRQSDVQIVYLPTKEVKTSPELENIFTKESATIEKIRKSMAADGFHPNEPLDIAQDKNGNIIGVADGNTRLMIAKELGIPKVPVMYLTFESLEAAIVFAKNKQFKRRNLTQAEIYRIATSLEHARTVEKRADEETKNQVKNNDISINQAYQKVRKKKEKNEDADEDTGGNPRPIFVRSRDMSEHLAAHIEESDYDKRMIERYLEGKKDGFAAGFQKGISEGTCLIFEKIKELIGQEKSSDEILNDGLFADFSYFIIAKKLDIPASNKEILEEYFAKSPPK